MKILLAEDEKDLLKIITLYLERDGHQVTTVKDGQEALDYIHSDIFDLAILDWMMPKADGLQVCREIRLLSLPTKIILLTAKSTTEDEIYGLEQGADDYIRKPFEPRILLLRIAKLFGTDRKLIWNDITMHLDTRMVDRNGIEKKLNRKEWELLEYFMYNQGVVLSREILLNRIWGLDYEGDPRTLDTHIRRLREKMGEDIVQTHKGVGYCMEKMS